MAKLFSDTLTTIFTLQQRLIELIDEAAATEFQLFEQFGEMEATITELEEAQNARERLTLSYSKLSTIVLRVAEYQPTAPHAMLNLLTQAIEQGQTTAAASQASIVEIKRNWNLS
jgi:hypothetical protein